MTDHRRTLPEFDPPEDNGRPENADWIAEHQARNLARALGQRPGRRSGLFEWLEEETKDEGYP